MKYLLSVPAGLLLYINFRAVIAFVSQLITYDETDEYNVQEELYPAMTSGCGDITICDYNDHESKGNIQLDSENGYYFILKRHIFTNLLFSNTLAAVLLLNE